MKSWTPEPVGEFQDLHGESCSIQQSNLADIVAIRLGRDDARMHLDRKMVTDLLPLLKRFVKTGELEP